MNASRNAGDRGIRPGIGAFETLEQRRMLAGNVTAVVDPATNTLVITGDGKSNDIAITFEFGIGVRLVGQDGTTVNNSAAPLEVAPNDPITIDTGNGDDVVEVKSVSEGVSLAFGGPLSIETGNGDDQVFFDDLTFTGVSISTGKGNDVISMNSQFLMETLVIDMGKGHDALTFSSGIADVIADDTTIDGGKGNDTITGLAHLDADSLVIVNVETTA